MSLSSRRAVVFGSTFGELYADALASAGSGYELAGICGRGSDRSRRLAERLSVPLLAHGDRLPEGTELACVVVRSGLLGGEGSAISARLLAQGVDVVQEHPVHQRELAENIRVARSSGRRYYLNTFYEHLPLVSALIEQARALDGDDGLLHVELAASYQVAYAAVDLLTLIARQRIQLDAVRSSVSPRPPGRALSGELPSAPRAVHFARVSGLLRQGLSFGLRVDMSLDPTHPDDSPHLLLRAEVTGASGTLLLADTQGPLLHLPRPHVPGREGHGGASVRTLVPAETRSFSESVREGWPGAIVSLLARVQRERDTLHWLSHAQRHLEVCRVWSEVSQQLGLPVFTPLQRKAAGEQQERADA